MHKTTLSLHLLAIPANAAPAMQTGSVDYWRMNAAYSGLLCLSTTWQCPEMVHHRTHLTRLSHQYASLYFSAI